MLFVIKNLLTLERLLPFSSVGYRARLLFICGLHKKNKGKVFSVYDLKAHRLILGTVPLILNPVIYIGLWLTSGPVTVSPEKNPVPTEQEFRWAQSRYGDFGKEKIIIVTGVRTPKRPARSK